MKPIHLINFFSHSPLRLFVLLLVAWGGVANCVAQSTIYVRVNGTNSNPATASSWANALSGTALQTTLATAPSGTTFLVGAGVYTPTISTDRTISFFIPSGVQLYGGYAGEGANPDARTTFPSSTTLSGVLSTSTNSYHVVLFTLASTATRLDGVVITGGKADGEYQDAFGGGVVIFTRNFGDVNTPTLTNTYFVGNSATFGGAMYNFADTGGEASPIVTNVNFSNNSATLGGALYNSSAKGNTSPSLTNVSFTNNSASNNGGAIYIRPVNNGSSALKLTNVSFVGNSATNAGGAIYNYNYASTLNTALTNVSFSSNSATSGAAFYNSSAGLNLYANPTLTNCVFFGNGGSNTLSNTSTAPITVAYSLLENSIPTSSYVDGGGNLSTASSPFISSTDLQLQLVSSAINKGNNSAYSSTNGPSIDLAGNVRIQNTIIDMGAFESPTGPDLSPTLSLPQANFAVDGPDSSRDFFISISEVGGQSTSSGNIRITLTAPTGYVLSFDSNLTSINVSGGSNNPVVVDNPNWQVAENIANQQLTLTINTGQQIESSSLRTLGFTITRATANSSSVSNITVNVTDDAGHSYDVNSANNVYTRIISGL